MAIPANQNLAVADGVTTTRVDGVSGNAARDCLGAVLFDVDGVLADTAKLHTAAWARLAGEERLPFQAEVADALRGLSREDSLRLLLGPRRVTQQSFEDMLDRKNAYYLDMVAGLSEADALPGAAGLLAQFARLGIRRAAVSLSRNARAVLGRIGMTPMLDVIMDGTDARGIPGGLDRYHRAAAALATSPRRCLVIEDSTSGIAAAKNAGMRTIGVGSPQRLCAADLVFESLQGVSARLLLRWLSGPLS